MGIDGWAWAKEGAAWHANEIHADRATNLTVNAQKLRLHLQLQQDDAQDWLAKLTTSHLNADDVLLCDPDRRVDGQRQSSGTNWSPDPAAWIQTLQKLHQARAG